MVRLTSLKALALASASALSVITGVSTAAHAQHWAPAQHNAYAPHVYGDHPYGGREMYLPGTRPVLGYSGSPYNNNTNPEPWQQAQQRQRDCNRGRLIGGIVGGGLGYVASRDDGRSWAVPLGALLGSQVGCNTGAGRGPMPW